MRVLVVDDNPVNRMVAARTLEKRGHRVSAVESGEAAVAAFENASFDVVVMDVQMPGMDGLEATARIREKERDPRVRVPIIALTAHAMKGDRERCLAAGMDDYVAKPFEVADLVRAVESGGREHAPEVAEGAQVLNERALLERVEGDRSMVSELARIFIDEASPLVEQIRAALRRGDAESLGRAAHRLRGTLTTMGAERAAAPALRLELASRGHDGEPSNEDLAELESELLRLEPELTRLAAM